MSPSTGSDSSISFTFKTFLCGLVLPDVKVSLELGQWFTWYQYSKDFLTLLRVSSIQAQLGVERRTYAGSTQNWRISFIHSLVARIICTFSGSTGMCFWSSGQKYEVLSEF